MKCDGCEPGWCERHGVHKSPHLVHLCQENERYFIAWEEGRGPGQRSSDKPPPTVKRQPTPVCDHRGEVVGSADCGCCGNQKIYRCGIHGLAMERKLKPGMVSATIGDEAQRIDVAYCNACGDFVADG